MTNKEAADLLENKILLCVVGEWREAIEQAINALKAQDWIPCKDRLPGQEQRVLINLSDGDTSVGWLLRGDIWFTDYSCGKPEDEVVAWMPRPEPYREGVQE